MNSNITILIIKYEIKLWLKIRFKEVKIKSEDNDDYANKSDTFKSLLKKIWWLESNSN